MTKNKNPTLAAVFETYKQRQDALTKKLMTIDDNILEGMSEAAYRDTNLYVAIAALSRGHTDRGYEQFELLNYTYVDKVKKECSDIGDWLKRLDVIYSELQNKYAADFDKTVIPKKVTNLIVSLSKLEERLNPYISIAEEITFQGKLASAILPDSRGPPGSWTNPTGDPYRDEISPYEIMFPPKRR